MAIQDRHGLPVIANENTEVPEAPVCLARHKVADELALKNRHTIGLHNRRVVSVDEHTDRRFRAVRKQSSDPGMDVASRDLAELAELAQAKYVERMNFERLGNV